MYARTGPAGVCPTRGEGASDPRGTLEAVLAHPEQGGRDWMEGQNCSQKASNPLSREAGRHSLSPSLYPPPDSLPRFLCGGAHVCFVNAGRRITKEGCAEGGVSGTTAGGCVEIPGREKSLQTGSPSLTLGSAWLVGGLRAPVPVPGPSHILLPLASSRPATCRA